MKKFGLILAGLALAASVFAINDVDRKGRKQGDWSKKHDNGELMYEGHFKDDKPFGEFKRYDEKGVLKAKQNYKDNDRSDVIIYEADGKTISAKGSYIGKLKDGEWSYYVKGKVSLIEPYQKGKKNGTVKVYANTGELIEEIPYVNDKIDGVRRCYLLNGKRQSEVAYKENVEHGDYKLYEGNDFPVMEGVYVNGKRNGDWLVRDNERKLLETLKYDNGVLLNNKELLKKQSGEAEQFEKNKGKFVEPESMMDTPK